ncbi:hypothetical protein GCM10023115_53050 [Pontixanthobacter gangjinensis]|uniref:DUF6268 domain-containing protein n=1 Tax=Christiangramia aestuarii TaxID=1028746 RepID=A0A7K1LQ06_9FLAO|nr:DUF6268 family outer membrane beta-barrel protein [Christiangramia aestuarii]MUP42887.1 hypothetical protein [Christiangramia aestuarii]
MKSNRIILIFWVLSVSYFPTCLGQSYFDIINLQYEHAAYSPGNTDNFSINRIQARFNFAFELENEDLILANYLGESFSFKDLKYNGAEIDLYSHFLSGGYLHFWKDKEWSFLAQARIKLNSDIFKPAFGQLQLGGWFMFTYNRNDQLSYFAGGYYNQEVNKDLIFPIGGLHWTPNDKWNLYVLIPSQVRFEWMLKKKSWYTGLESDWTLNTYLLGNNPDIYYFRKETLLTSFFIEKHLSEKLVLYARIGNYQINDYEAFNEFEQLITQAQLDSDLIKNISLQAGLAYRLRFR